MTNLERVLVYLQKIYPEYATNSQIGSATGVKPHQQVFQKTNQLMEKKIISGRYIEREWRFQAIPGRVLSPLSAAEKIHNSSFPFTPTGFEGFAREKFSHHFETPLTKGYYPEINKEWDLISVDRKIIGDTKYYTMVGGKDRPPAKFSNIAEHVWLLEKIKAENRFLVFGNQIEVPKLWIEKYGSLVLGVQFYFLDDAGKITKLN